VREGPTAVLLGAPKDTVVAFAILLVLLQPAAAPIG
jgi:hypothetical protein